MMNGWSSLAPNKDSPIEYYFASDARSVLFLFVLIHEVYNSKY